MLTHDDLLAIGSLIDEKIKPLKEGQDGLNTRMGGLETQLERIEKKLDREVTDLAENVREIMVKLDKLDDHETRISQLERNLVPRSH